VHLLLKSASALLAAAALALGAPLTAQAAQKAGPTTVAATTGNDVSWPQCGKVLPTKQAFAIVGVNGGLANDSNRCFDQQWTWAQSSPGTKGQPNAAVYVNTANPELAGSWWPKNNYAENDPVPVPVPTAAAYNNGTCDGTASVACAYVYGWSKAYDDVHSRHVAVAADLRWWLDVETGNSWSSKNIAANRADLEAMATVFQKAGRRVGVYSTRYQYGAIVGTVDSSSALYPLDSWLAGGSSLKGAQSLCSATALTGGSHVTMTQYVSGAFDYDVSCIG
jgi:hypothetical protein